MFTKELFDFMLNSLDKMLKNIVHNDLEHCAMCNKDFCERSAFKIHLKTHKIDRLNYGKLVENPNIPILGLIIKKEDERNHLSEKSDVPGLLETAENNISLLQSQVYEAPTLRIAFNEELQPEDSQPPVLDIADSENFQSPLFNAETSIREFKSEESILGTSIREPKSEESILSTSFRELQTVENDEAILGIAHNNEFFSEDYEVPISDKQESQFKDSNVPISGLTVEDNCWRQTRRNTNHIAGKRQVSSENYEVPIAKKSCLENQINFELRKLKASSTLKTIATDLASVENMGKYFKCCICDKTYEKNVDLYMHLLKEHSDLQFFSCEICGFQVSCRFMQEVHYKAHILRRPMEYVLNSLGYKLLQRLKEHINLHKQMTTLCQMLQTNENPKAP